MPGAEAELDATKLHADGWLELQKLPEWEVFDMVESYYRKYHDRIVKLLERERPRWFEDVLVKEGVRPGAVVADELSMRFLPKGVYVSAVHPSMSDDESCNFPVTGPRFYVSVMQAAMRRGPAPGPPKSAAEMLWPDPKDRQKPWITEVGWTMVPPNSDAQALHADIISTQEEITDHRLEGQGRFHHYIWKPDRVTNCTTGVVSSAFTNGDVKDWMWRRLQTVASPAVVLDSEVCHRGSPTGPGKWTASCTVQLCSSSGWAALQTRASEVVLEYTCPIDFGISGPWVELPVASQLKPWSHEAVEEALALNQGGKVEWAAGSLVEALFEGGWFAATVGTRHADETYSVFWDGEERTCSEGVPLTSIRARRWPLGAEVEAQWDGEWYPAKVAKVRNNWSYRVDWACGGTCSHHVYHWSIRSKKASSVGCQDEPCCKDLTNVPRPLASCKKRRRS